MWPQSVLSAFGRVTVCRRANTWKACCPVHDDRTPSLGLWLGRNGALIVRCWARRERCPVQAIVQAVGLKMSDLFPPGTDSGPYAREHRLKQEVARTIAATYPYHDERGRLLYEVVRFEPKDFRQRRPDGRGGWIWSLGDVRRVLFHLPLIVQRVREPVLIVEGEKDVLLLEDLGFLATTNPGGTGMGWSDSYAQSLCGRRVVVIPDNDDAGRAHADRVAGSLLRTGVESLRIVTLPGVERGGDVTDWVFSLADGMDPKTELIGLVKGSHEWRAK